MTINIPEEPGCVTDPEFGIPGPEEELPENDGEDRPGFEDLDEDDLDVDDQLLDLDGDDDGEDEDDA